MAVIPYVVVLRALGLGDLLTAVPALRALRRGFPDAELVLATPRSLAPLVALTGAIDRVENTSDLTRAWSGPLSGAAKRRVDLAVNLHGRGPQSIDALRRLQPLNLLSFAHPDHPEVAGPAWDPDRHEVDRWCDLVGWAGLPADRADLRLATPPVAPTRSGAVIVHPGASAEARRWPADRFAEVARTLAERGSTVVITGSGAERPLAARVAAQAAHPAVQDVAGRLDIEALAATVAAAQLVVCGDTGVAHLASAYGVPSVVLFGPTPPARWGPPAGGPHIALWHGEEGDPHAATVSSGLLAVSVPDVLAAVDRVIIEMLPPNRLRCFG